MQCSQYALCWHIVIALYILNVKVYMLFVKTINNKTNNASMARFKMYPENDLKYGVLTSHRA